MRRLLSFLVGATLGGLVGAAAALLLAPKSGVELRLEMRNRGERLRGEVTGAMDAKRAELEAQLKTLRSPKPTKTDVPLG